MKIHYISFFCVANPSRPAVKGTCNPIPASFAAFLNCRQSPPRTISLQVISLSFLNQPAFAYSEFLWVQLLLSDFSAIVNRLNPLGEISPSVLHLHSRAKVCTPRIALTHRPHAVPWLTHTLEARNKYFRFKFLAASITPNCWLRNPPAIGLANLNYICRVTSLPKKVLLGPYPRWVTSTKLRKSEWYIFWIC